MSATPRTDAEVNEDTNAITFGFVTAGFARELETELAAKEAECEALKSWKAQQLAVEAQWDPQAVGRALDLPVGCFIREQILPAIEAKNAECEALRDALETVVKVEPLWLPTDVDPEHAHEAHALHALADIVHRALAGRKEGA